jgi:hypothetical protein
LNLPAAEINMIIGCGVGRIRVYGERFRVPLKKSILNYNPILNKTKPKK